MSFLSLAGRGSNADLAAAVFVGVVVLAIVWSVGRAEVGNKKGGAMNAAQPKGPDQMNVTQFDPVKARENVQDFNRRTLANLPPQDFEVNARRILFKKLQASASVAAVAEILNAVDCQQRGLAPCDLRDRALTEVRRLIDLAESVLARVEPDDDQQAVAAAAEVISLGEGGAMPFSIQPPRIRTHYLCLAQSAINAYHETLTGRRV